MPYFFTTEEQSKLFALSCDNQYHGYEGGRPSPRDSGIDDLELSSALLICEHIANHGLDADRSARLVAMMAANGRKTPGWSKLFDIVTDATLREAEALSLKLGALTS